MHKIQGFALNQLIYEGANTLIYRGIQLKDNKKVIIKTLKKEFPTPEILSQFKSEYRILTMLQEMGTAKVLGLETQGSIFAIIMEDDDSYALKTILKGKPLDFSLFFKIAIEIVEVLEFIHSQHIIHKDLNPFNILLNDTTQKIKIIDFGISSILLKENLELQNLQKIEGMLDYISPEQTGRMNRTIDYRSDFYSLGVSFYEMLTGRVPFKGEGVLEMVHNHLAKIPDAVTHLNPSVPLMVEKIVSKLMAKIPEERYMSAAGIKADLLECQKQWQYNKTILPFELGQKESYDRLFFSQKLYGRNQEVSQILAVFDEVSQGRNSFLLIGGFSGIGKTSLVKEIYKPITKQSGYFISGKYDQLKKSSPYSAFIEAFQDLIRYLLCEPEKTIEELRHDLLIALGSYGQIIIDVIPNIELIIGPQPAVNELTPAAAKSRFILVFQNFVRALAQKNHPLVIFLDDLQWIDTASLQLIQVLLTDKELKYFFLIGAYRDNEVYSDHPLIFTEQQLKKAHVNIHHMALQPLKSRDIHQLFADTLNMNLNLVADFADLILKKTHGNPFYIYEFIRKIHQNGLLHFDYHHYKWHWDLEKIENEISAENVVELVIHRISDLTENAQQLLQLAAAIGFSFDLQTLHIISQQPYEIIGESLLEAIQADLITPLNKNYQLLELFNGGKEKNLSQKIEYRFIHDRVQQASYELIQEEKKAHLHLDIAHLLLQNMDHALEDERIFTLLNHYNHSLHLINDENEKLKIARFNLWAGRKAKISAAHAAAMEYLNAGLILLTTLDMSKKSEIFFELSKELATCQYLTGNFEAASQGYKKLLQDAKESLSVIEIYKLHCQMLTVQNEHEQAIHLGLEALKKLHFRIPAKPNKMQLLFVILKTQCLISRYNLETYELPLLTSKEQMIILDILGQTMLSALIVNEPLFVYLACLSVQISFKHGYSKYTTAPGLSYTIIILIRFKAYKLASKLMNFFARSEDKYGLVFSKCRYKTLLGAFLGPWNMPIEKCFDDLLESNQLALEEGEYFIAVSSNAYAFCLAVMLGKTFEELNIITQNSRRFMERANMEDLVKPIILVVKMLDTLTHSSLSDIPNLEDQLKSLYGPESRLTDSAAAFVKLCSVFIYYLHGCYKEATEHGYYMKYSDIVLSDDPMSVVCLFFHALSIYTNPTLDQRSKRYLNRIYKKFKKWASLMPDNFNFYLWLLEAERAKSMNDTTHALAYYYKAINLADAKQNVLHIALANECAGRYFLTLKYLDMAKTFYLNAHYAYQHWGGKQVCQHIENLHPDWFRVSMPLTGMSTHVTIDTAASSLDVLSLLHATQVISSEIQLDVLLKKLIIVLLKNAGAQRGALIVKQDDLWYVAVEGTTAAQQFILNPDKSKSIEYRKDYPLSLIRYVQRTGTQVLAQSHLDFESYAEDPYIKEVKPQSIILMPLSYQRQMNTILFLENRTTSHAFTPQHLHILKVLSAQAIISLENARLYYQATHDPLTNLANRNLLYQMFELIAGRAKRNRTTITILFLDLDGFKKINDTLGHEIGDKLLIWFAGRLKECIREGDLAVRLGGDEFVLMLEDIDQFHLIQLASRLLDSQQPFKIDDQIIKVGTSIGISIFPDHGQNIPDLLKKADIALYHVKETGKGNYQIYSYHLDQEVKEENRLEFDLKTAAQRGQLTIFYQPIYESCTHKILHLEALLRWQHPTLGLLEPDKFIHIAESTGDILAITEWVLRTVLKQMKNWKNAHINLVPVAVNISGLHLKKESLSKFLQKLLNEFSIDPNFLELELTENIFIEKDEAISEDLKQLKQLGVTLTLDDFGSHYSNLNYLQRFNVDRIKIDQSFIHDLFLDDKNKKLIITIIKMAHSLNLKVIAEGVETNEQLLFLEAHHIDGIQGFYLNHPLKSDEIGLLLKNNQTVPTSR